MTTRALGVVLAFSVALISAMPATAGMVYKFDGLVQSVTGTSPFGSPAVGDTISGTFTLTGNPTFQIYYPIDSAGWAPVQDFTIGSFSFPAGWHNTDAGYGTVVKDFADTANDWFDVEDDRYAPDWLSSLWFDVQFLGLSLPHWYTLPSAADLAPASYALFSVQILGNEGSLTPIYLMSGSITSVTTTPVPEPASLGVLAFSFIGLCAARRVWRTDSTSA